MALDPAPKVQLVYPVARQFVDRCLAQGDSLFTPGRPVWANETLEDLWQRFAGHPDEGSAKFLEKLEIQLKEAPPLTIQLAAELLCIYFLVPSATRQATKLEQIRTVLSWSPDPPQVPEWIQTGLAGGIVSSGGTAYATMKPFLLWYLIDVARHLRALPAEQLARTLADPWQFRDLAYAVEPRGGPSMREALLHFVHPESFENITSHTSKEQIAAGYAELVPPELEAADLDQRLLAIRSRLAETHTGPIHFFLSPFVERWKPDSPPPIQSPGPPASLPLPDATWLLTWNPESFPWPSQQIAEMIARLDRGEDVVDRWSVGNTKSLRRGDRFYLLRLGSEPRGIVASGRILGGVEAGPHWNAAQAAAGKTSLFAPIRFDELLDSNSTPPLAQSTLEQQFAKVNWRPQASGTSLPDKLLTDIEVAWQRHLAQAAAAALRTAANTSQLEESLASFASALAARQEETRFGIAHVENWVADAKGFVAPSKWAGFRGMTPVIYAALQKLQAESDGTRGFVGSRARGAITKLTGQQFAPNPELTARMRELFRTAFGSSAVDGVKPEPVSWIQLGPRPVVNPQPPKEAPVPAQNIILYGPPGTGKTYATARRAVELCDGDNATPRDPEALTTRYRALVDMGRIQFVTFHQSFAYEDFVEGIRPVIDEAGTTAGDVRYECRAGVFKSLCDRAQGHVEVAPSAASFDPAAVPWWKMSIGRADDPEDEELYAEAIRDGLISLGWGDPLDFTGCDDGAAVQDLMTANGQAEAAQAAAYPWRAVEMFKNRMKIGDLVVVSSGNRAFRAVGRVTGPYRFLARDRHTQLRSVEWLVKLDPPQPIDRIYRRQLGQSSVYRLDPEQRIVDGMRALLAKPTPATEGLPYVLIIDEINRGNVSKIFGELITLLEPDKRMGAPNELRVRLPYSQTQLGVPANLHVIGTMNSADRSIALLDTALRRRFRFEEIRPSPQVIRNLVGDDGVVDGVDVAGLLTLMNRRIELLLGRDHALGHAFFLGVRSLDDLCRVFRDAVLPLLAEYFYDDHDKICRVLGCPHDDRGQAANPAPILRGEVLDAGQLLGRDDGWGSKMSFEINPDFAPGKGRLARFFAGIAGSNAGA